MSIRATMRLFWWFLSCATCAVDRLETVTVVPVFPGEIFYFMVGNTVTDHSESSEDQNEAEHECTDGEHTMAPQQRCSIVLLTIRVLTLVIAIGFLLSYRRLCPYVPGNHNCTTERMNYQEFRFS